MFTGRYSRNDPCSLLQTSNSSIISIFLNRADHSIYVRQLIAILRSKFAYLALALAGLFFTKVHFSEGKVIRDSSSFNNNAKCVPVLD